MTDGRDAGFDLLEKTELRIEHVTLDNANLTDIAFLDVGRAIVDAPLLDMRMEIVTG